MKIKNILLLILSVILFNNCASVKLAETSFTIDEHTLKGKKILVIAKSEDLKVRKAYENELVHKLSKEGFEAVAAYELFPNLKENRNTDAEEVKKIVNLFKSKGVESILVTSLRSKKTLKPEPVINSETSSSNIKGKYGFSFVDYYNINSIEYLSSSLRPVDRNSEPEIYESFLESTVYTLEAVVYDLSLPKTSQLAGVYEVEAIDPKSAKQVLERFTTIVAKQIK
ncbi:hypothetical protein [Winogradskyella haliclonae]|uniref:Neuraminyllactose-binding hemagglutinin n=1 Tax=Winogradskyella haliclonae TaxID=2048558 RepID=A0ABQ2BX05_9FLAO|nr:hypothetical protein [Winogradskyella haliclonae]GGI56991.1 hypothetical protein GCM10011444_13000 [Winogradskyella haliclonae]